MQNLTYPRTFALVAEGVAGNGIGAPLTMWKIVPAVRQPIAIEEIIVTSPEIVEVETLSVRVASQEDDGTFTLGPADVDAIILGSGDKAKPQDNLFRGEISYLATVEPSVPAAPIVRRSEIFRVGLHAYLRPIPGTLTIFPGECYGVILTSTQNALLHTVTMICSYP